METSTSHVPQTMTQSGYVAVVTQINASSKPAIDLATHFLAATEDDDATQSPNASPTSTNSSYEMQAPPDTSFSRTRTIIAVLVAILMFAGIVTLLLCLGTRGRGHPTGENELQSMSSPSARTRRRQSIIQSASPPLAPPRYSAPWSQTTPNPFANQFQLEPEMRPTANDFLSRLIPTRIRDRYPRLPMFTAAFPEFAPPFYTPTPSRAPHPVDSVAQPNIQPLSIHSSHPPTYNPTSISSRASDSVAQPNTQPLPTTSIHSPHPTSYTPTTTTTNHTPYSPAV